jgi:rare lipoprotein A
MEKDPMNRRLVLIIICAVAISGCGKKKVVAVTPPPVRPAPAPAAPIPSLTPPAAGTIIERGLASWYGHPYHGRRAADGEIYDMETLVAAHRTLAFQTIVRVHNLSNDKTVDVRIIDRGPFVDGRVIDLSHAAAKQIDLIGPGVARVELVLIGAPATPELAAFAVQIGAFRDKANADRQQQSMIAAYGAAKEVLRQGDPPIWRILAGREPSPEAAEMLARRIRADQHEPQAFVVRLDP